MQLNLFPDRSQDDNLIRLMLQPPKAEKDDPYFQAAAISQRKRRRAYKV